LKTQIDLQKGIRKIASRQSLNDVHILVQLLRKALEGQPRTIEFRRRGQRWVVSHDGAPPSQVELNLLKRLLNGDGSLEDLDQLELQFGITFLSLFVGFDAVELQVGDHILKKIDETWNDCPTTYSVPGFQFVFHTKKPMESDPAQELEFYGGSVEAELRFNGIRINRPKRVPELLLQLTWQDAQGKGLVGIPMHHADSTFHFYKRGVLFGVRHDLAVEDKRLYGYWDSNLYPFESEFKASIRSGQHSMKKYGQELYQQIPDHFDRFDHSRKQCLKNILIGLSLNAWLPEFERLPLFEWEGRPFSLSMAEIRHCLSREFSLPFSPKEKRSCARLGLQDLYFLKEKAGIPLRMV